MHHVQKAEVWERNQRVEWTQAKDRDMGSTGTLRPLLKQPLCWDGMRGLFAAGRKTRYAGILLCRCTRLLISYDTTRPCPLYSWRLWF